MKKIAFFGDSLTQGIIGRSFVDLISESLGSETKTYNYGFTGDTVLSNYNRLKKKKLSHYDYGIIWIGTNDIIAKYHKRFPKIKKALRQTAIEDLNEFKEVYQKNIDLILKHSDRIITVSISPLEELVNNSWREDVKEINDYIKKTSKEQNMEYIDLIPEFQKIKNNIEYIPDNEAKVINDFFNPRAIKNPEAVAKRRGYHYTYDGIHLTNAGAKLVAEKILKKIDSTSF